MSLILCSELWFLLILFPQDKLGTSRSKETATLSKSVSEGFLVVLGKQLKQEKKSPTQCFMEKIIKSAAT